MRDAATMQQKILFSPQELRVKVTFYSQIPPEFTQIAWGLAIKSGHLGVMRVKNWVKQRIWGEKSSRLAVYSPK